MKPNLTQVALVFLGGALGTAARYAVSLTMPQLGTLFVVNLLGAAFLGWVNSSRVFESNSSKAFWGVGFAGGFTTMSGVALWLVAAVDNALFAPFTVLAMFALGVFAYFAGLRLGRIGQSAEKASTESASATSASAPADEEAGE